MGCLNSHELLAHSSGFVLLSLRDCLHDPDSIGGCVFDLMPFRHLPVDFLRLLVQLSQQGIVTLGKFVVRRDQKGKLSFQSLLRAALLGEIGEFFIVQFHVVKTPGSIFLVHQGIRDVAAGRYPVPEAQRADGPISTYAHDTIQPAPMQSDPEVELAQLRSIGKQVTDDVIAGKYPRL